MFLYPSIKFYSKHISGTHVKLSYKFQELFRTWHHLDTCQIETRATNFKICIIIFTQSQNKLIINEKIRKKQIKQKTLEMEKKIEMYNHINSYAPSLYVIAKQWHKNGSYNLELQILNQWYPQEKSQRQATCR